MDILHDFGIIEDTLPNGLFGGVLNWIVKILPFLKQHTKYPLWNINTKLYGPIMNSILISKQCNTTNTNKISVYKLKENHFYYYTLNECQLAHDLFFEYFDIHPDIITSVETIVSTFGKKTLGIHYRGTDKLNTEANYISKEVVIRNISVFLSQEDTFDTLFIASDETEFLTKMMQEFPTYKIITSNSVRSMNTTPIHFNNSNIERAKEAMIDSLTLSKCDYVIKTSSCLSDWVKIWNPSIEVYNLNKFRYSWFPQAIIPVRSYI